MTDRKKYLLFSAILLALDRLTKVLVQGNMAYGESLTVVGKFLRITHTTNTGIAFGMAQGKNFFFLGLSIIILLFLVIFFLRTAKKAELLPAMMIITGALGNIIDRIADGAVCDFIEVNLGFPPFNPWPIFNLSDSLITVGGILLFYMEFAHKSKM